MPIPRGMLCSRNKNLCRFHEGCCAHQNKEAKSFQFYQIRHAKYPTTNITAFKSGQSALAECFLSSCDILHTYIYRKWRGYFCLVTQHITLPILYTLVQQVHSSKNYIARTSTFELTESIRMSPSPVSFGCRFLCVPVAKKKRIPLLITLDQHRMII